MTYWAVYAPDGEFWVAAKLRRTAKYLAAFMHNNDDADWSVLAKLGYRCHKVTITRSNP